MTLDTTDRRYCVLALLCWARNAKEETTRLDLLDRAERIAQVLEVDIAEVARQVELAWEGS